MRIILKFAKSNIKNAKAKVIVLVLCVAISCFIFAASICVPMFIRQYNVDLARSFYGDSDAYMAPEDFGTQRYSSMSYVPQETKDKCEYIYTMFAYQDYVTMNDENLLYNIIGVNYDELMNFNNTIKLNTKLTSLGELEIIISEKMAKKYNLSTGSIVKLSTYKYSAKVVAVAKPTGYFTDGQNIFTSKQTLIKLMKASGASLLTKANKDTIFNLAVMKFKPDIDADQTRDEFDDYLKNISVTQTVDEEAIQGYIDFIIGPFLFVASIVMVFCVFIILLICNIIFTERLKEFATLKSLGATNGHLVGSLVLESGTYGGVGGVFGALFVFLLEVILQHIGMTYIRGIPVLYFVYFVLFGVGFSIISALIPAIIHSRKSIRQTMILSSKSKLFNYIWSIGGATLGVFAVISAILVDPMERNIFPILTIACALLSIIMLSPYIIYGIVQLFYIVFRKVGGFASVYVKNNTLTSSVSMMIRLTTFGLAIFLLLNILPSLVKTAVNSEVSRTVYDIQLRYVDDDKDAIVDYLNGIDEVSYVYKTYDSRSEKEYSYDFDINKLCGFTYDTIVTAYGNTIVGNKEEVLNKLKDEEHPYILVGQQFAIFNDLEIGDIVSFDITIDEDAEDKEDRVSRTSFVIAGFTNAMQQVNSIMVFNVEYINKAYNKELSNAIEVKLKSMNDYQKVYDAIKSNPLCASADIYNVTGKTNDLIFALDGAFLIVNGYSYMVMGLSFIAIAIAMILSLKNNIQQHKIMSLLGMSKKMYLRNFFFLMLCIILIGAPLGIACTAIVFGLLTNALVFFGAYLLFTMSYVRLFVSCAIAMVLLMVISMWIANSGYKDFVPKMIVEEG